MKRFFRICPGIVLSLFVVGLGFEANRQVFAAEPQVLYPSPSSMAIVGSFYTDAENSPSSIESIDSWGSYLYLAVRYVNGDQKLEVWDVRDPANPSKVQSLDYGNLYEDPRDNFRFPYVNVFDDTIVVRSDCIDYMFKPNEQGELVQVATNEFAGSVAGILDPSVTYPMSSAGSYATYFGQLYEPYQVAPEEEYGYRILNFTNPLRPFVATLVPPKMIEELNSEFHGHLNAALQNMPGVISISDGRLRLSVRKIRSESFVDVFWRPRFPEIFNTEALDRTVRSQIDEIIESSPLTDRFTASIDRFFASLELDVDATIGSVIQTKYEPDVRLEAILEEYGIDKDESVRSAVRKLILAQLQLDLEKELSSNLFRPLLSDWTNELFDIPIDGTPDEFKTAIADVVNDGLSSETVGRYLLDNYVVPLLEDSDAEWIFWTLDQLVDEVVDSDLGEAVSVIIGSAHEVATGGGFLEVVLDLIPESDRFPSMVDFPEDCRDVLEYVLYDGADLNPDGLAFIEMLKLYQYYNGDDDYLDFDLELANTIRDLQIDLSGSFVETVQPFLAAYSYAGDMSERLSSFSGAIPSQEVISKAIADAIVARLESAGVDVDRTVHEICVDLELYLELTDAPGVSGADLAQVNDLLDVLENDLQESQTRVRDLWNEGKTHSQYLEIACRRALADTVREAWGEIDLDITLDSAMCEFLSNHVDTKWTFGDPMDDLLKEFVHSTLTEYPMFADYISLAKRAANDDGVAQWELTFKIAKNISAMSEPTGTTSATCESIELAIQESFHKALAATMEKLVYQYTMAMLNKMFGGHAAWVSRTQHVNYEFDIDDLTSLNAVRSEAFVWENRIGVVAREAWNYTNPRRVGLALFNPNLPQKSKQEYVFDSLWGVVDYVHAADGILLVGGTMYDGIWPNPSAAFLALEDDTVDLQVLQDYRLSSAEGMTSVNHGTHLVVYGPGGVFLLTNPMTVSEAKDDGDTHVDDWMIRR